MKRMDPAPALLVRKLYEPYGVRLVALRPDVSSKHTRRGDRLVLLLEIAVGEEVDQVVDCGLAELGAHQVCPSRYVGRVDRRGMGSEPVSDLLGVSCAHRSFTPTAWIPSRVLAPSPAASKTGSQISPP